MKKEVTIEQQAVRTADDGIVELDTAIIQDLGDLLDARHLYFIDSTGRVRQGGGARDGYHYVALPSDMTQERRDQLVVKLRALGWVRVEGVRCQGLQALILRTSDSNFDRLQARRSGKSKQRASEDTLAAQELPGTSTELKVEEL